MKKTICPVCGSVERHVREDTKLVWGTCRCGAKYTSEGGLNVKEGWVKVGCWEPPKGVSCDAFVYIDIRKETQQRGRKRG